MSRVTLTDRQIESAARILAELRELPPAERCLALAAACRIYIEGRLPEARPT